MDAPQIAIAIESLQQPANLSFLTLSDAVLSSGSIADSNGARSSNIASTDGLPGSVTPAFLMAELAHYQELFSKLRLMYVEQVTKERLLKAIAADPPQLADARENDALAEQLVTEKAALKAKKEEVARMTKGLEEMGRNLVRSHESIQLRTAELESLPEEIAGLEATIAELKASQETRSTDPNMSLPLDATMDLLSQREAELAELDRELADLQSALPRTKREVAKLESELKPLEARKREAIQDAQEAQRVRAKGDMQDELEEKGRWLKSVDAGLRAMLEV